MPILGGIEAFKDAVKAADVSAAMTPGVSVILPVGLGVLLGVVGVSNLLKWLLARYERQTLGVLLGLLVGAVVGLWPFQQGEAPEPGDTMKGQTVERVDGQLILAETGRAVEAEDYPTAFFSPTGGQIGGAVGLIALGFGVTALVARLGRDKPERSATGSASA